MSLKHRTKIYLSLNDSLLEFAIGQASSLGMTRSKYITSLLAKEYDNCKKREIDRIIEGAEAD